VKISLASWVLALLLSQSSLLSGQTSDTDAPVVAKQASAVRTASESVDSELERFQVEGVVTERRKYSFAVEENGQKYEVKVIPDTVIGLRMKKPWFDWESGVVVVDSTEVVSKSASKALEDSRKIVRKAIQLPAEKLFVISRFREKEQMELFFKTDDKRINFYLVTPFDPGQHMPTNEQPYISGALSVESDQSLRLNIGGNAIPVRLGFRDATMNGFSISQLVPERTRVLLSGYRGKLDKQITAQSIVFEPIHQR